MSSIQDYPCTHRPSDEPNEHGRFACNLVPERISAPLGVSAATCTQCWYRNRELAPLPAKEEQPRPTFAERARNFLLAMKDELAWRATGGAGPTEEERAGRRATCDACEHRDAEHDGCSVCGCYLEPGLLPPRTHGKLDCSTQACPAGKWGYAGGYEPPRNQPRRCCGGG